jgi:hypothetical protein
MKSPQLDLNNRETRRLTHFRNGIFRLAIGGIQTPPHAERDGLDSDDSAERRAVRAMIPGKN